MTFVHGGVDLMTNITSHNMSAWKSVVIRTRPFPSLAVFIRFRIVVVSKQYIFALFTLVDRSPMHACSLDAVHVGLYYLTR